MPAMSDHYKAQGRVHKGVPDGGEFTGKVLPDADPTVRLEDDNPIELTVGSDVTFTGDGNIVLEYNVQRVSTSLYAASAYVSAGSASYLLGAEQVDDEAFAELMAGARWNAMTRLLEDHFGAVVTDRGEVDELILDVGHDFDNPPTEQEVIDATSPAAARIRNETDARTGGAQFVGTRLRQFLDDRAFCEPYPVQSDGRWRPHDPMPLDQALEEARTSSGSHPVSDGAAQALAAHLAAEHGGTVFEDLSRDGYAERSRLVEATGHVGAQHAYIAATLARWAEHQTTTSKLIEAASRRSHTSWGTP